VIIWRTFEQRNPHHQWRKATGPALAQAAENCRRAIKALLPSKEFYYLRHGIVG
jgi:hypothetical protein